MNPAAAKITAAVLVLGQLFAGNALAAQPAASLPEIRALFEQELFELAHTVFLANGKPVEALAVAERAIRARPSDKVWRKKAAQTAEWAGRPDLALEQWFYLGQQGSLEGRQSALRLSRALQEFPLRKQLLEQAITDGTADPAQQLEYLTVAEGMGLPQDVYALLASGKLGGFDQAWSLTEQARLAEHLGRPVEAAKAWEQRATLKPLGPDESLKLASLWYGQGDTTRSWHALQLGSPNAPATATAFWRNYADLAWAVGDGVQTARAADLLIHAGTATEADYQRMFDLYGATEPQRAYDYALQGWKKFQKPVFWYAMADSGLRNGRGRDLALFLKGLDPEGRSRLAHDARSWMAMAQVYRQTGNLQSSVTAARIATRLAPADPDLLGAYLWLLVDLKQISELRHLVLNWEGRISTMPELREPLAAAMVLLGDAPRALRHYRLLASQRQGDPAWLASFGDVLEQAGYPEVAWKVRHRAQTLVLTQLRQQNNQLENARRTLLIQAQLMMHLKPGDALSATIRRIAAARQDDFGNELILGWAMTTGQPDLARFWYWRCFARAAQRPEWAHLSFALEENDRTVIGDLVEAHLDRLPYRDAVEGARRAGMTLLSQQHAFDRFQINDSDHLLDKQLRDLYEQHPARLRYDISVQDRSGVGLLEQQLLAELPLSNRIRLKLNLLNTDISHLKTGVLGVYTSSIQSAQLGLGYRHSAGTASLAAGARDALYRYPFALFAGDLRLDSRLVLDTSLGAGVTANETVPLLIGGMKDEATLGVSLQLSARDTVRLRTALFRFMDQNRYRLGSGAAVDLEWGHRLTVAWPDFTARLYGGYHDHHATGVPIAKTRALIPKGSKQDDAQFFIPKSFGQIGAGAAFGQTWKETYTREWKGFGSLDSWWNSVSGIGFHYELGVVGPLFGLDALMFALSQESGAFGNSSLSSRFDMLYRYYFY